MYSEPGGFIQWDEADLAGVYVTSANQQTSCSALDDLRRKSIELVSASKGAKFQ